MVEFSATLESRNLPTLVNSSQDVDALINGFDGVMKGLNLWQYYVLDVTRERETVKAALSSKKVEPWTGADVAHKSVIELAEIVRSSGKVKGLAQYASRFGVSVDGAVAAGIVQAAFVDLSDADALADAWTKVVDVLNVPLYQEWEADVKVALDNIRNRLNYTRLDEHGPKMGKITKE